MTLDDRQWYVRWFLWSLGIYDAFRDRDTASWIKHTNLCFFLRVTLVYAPLILTLHVILYGLLIAVFTVLPMTLFGGSAYSLTAGGIVGVVLFIWGIKAAGNRVNEWQYQRRLRRWRAEREKAEAHVPTAPTFFEILGEWFAAQKQKVCPSIMIERHEQEVRS